MKITYSVEFNPHSKLWVVWKTIEKERSIGCISIYKGNRKECAEKLKELKNDKRRI